MTVANEEVQLIGSCEDLSIDFCSQKSGKLILSLIKDNEKIMSAEMNFDKVKHFISILENPPNSSMTELTDGRCEERDSYRYFYAMNNSETLQSTRIGVGQHRETIKVVIQTHNYKTQVGYIDIPKLDVRLLIGLLYLWLSNNFLSSRTIHAIFKTNLFKCEKLSATNIKLPIDC